MSSRTMFLSVFHENEKLEFYLLLFTTADPWSKYLKNKISKFFYSGFLQRQASMALGGGGGG